MAHQVVNLSTHRKATVNLNTAHHKASMVAILHKARCNTSKVHLSKSSCRRRTAAA